MGMLWSRLDKMRLGAAARGGPEMNVVVAKPPSKATAKPAATAERQGFRGDTIVALRPHHYPLKVLSGGAYDNDVATREQVLKLFKIRFADSDGRRRSASFLVQRRYAWRGYQVDAPVAGQNGRITLSAFDGDDVVATITVGHDSSASGLFVNALFGAELTALRERGGTVCEFTKLAIDEAIKSKAVLAALFHIAYIHARRICVCSDLVVEVNPRHVRFYERMLGFTMLGSTREDQRVGAPATLLHLDLAHAEGQIAKYGGKPEFAADVRSLYPYFFSAQEEADVEMKLRSFG